MAKKIYKCGGSQPSLNINLPNGKPYHVTFEAHTGGGGIFVTDNKDVQYGLEHHWRYGKLFTGRDLIEEAPSPVEEPSVEAESETDNQPTIVPVSSIEDAKEYIAVQYGISRSKLRTPAAIVKHAEENNVKFEGCDALYAAAN